MLDAAFHLDATLFAHPTAFLPAFCALLAISCNSKQMYQSCQQPPLFAVSAGSRSATVQMQPPDGRYAVLVTKSHGYSKSIGRHGRLLVMKQTPPVSAVRCLPECLTVLHRSTSVPGV
jgi:hypothetical protein